VEIIPRSKMQKIGMDVKFECVVYYLGLYFIEWTFQDNNLPSNAKSMSKFLIIKNLQYNNGGIYSCEIKSHDGRGIGKASGKLEVVGKFSILSYKYITNVLKVQHYCI